MLMFKNNYMEELGEGTFVRKKFVQTQCELFLKGRIQTYKNYLH
jgi:hypothetical protein